MNLKIAMIKHIRMFNLKLLNTRGLSVPFINPCNFSAGWFSYGQLPKILYAEALPVTLLIIIIGLKEKQGRKNSI